MEYAKETLARAFCLVRLENRSQREAAADLGCTRSELCKILRYIDQLPNDEWNQLSFEAGEIHWEEHYE
jgi:hypothetical protein